jgi:hypothetical protein
MDFADKLEREGVKSQRRLAVLAALGGTVALAGWVAAGLAGLGLIGGMDRGFKRKLNDALRAMDDVGLSPGITSGFRDDYRQELVSGNKAASDSSYHGGSLRGGFGHGLAADLVREGRDTCGEMQVE